MPGFPETNIDLFYQTIYGGFGFDLAGFPSYLSLAAGLPQAGANPPYTVSDFLAMYPKFFGPATAVTGALLTAGQASVAVPIAGLATGQLVAGTGIGGGSVIQAVGTAPVLFTGDTFVSNSQVTNVSSILGLVAPCPVSAANLEAGTVIQAFGTNRGVNFVQVYLDPQTTATGVAFTATVPGVTLSANATASGLVNLSAYEAQLVPLAVIQAYLNVAYASLMQTRWREAWPLAMALYIAHFCTLYLQTDGNPQTTAGQAVANGLQAGITVSQAADGVSQGLQPLIGLDNWAAWTLTSYGVQLATMARAVGAGAVYFRSA